MQLGYIYLTFTSKINPVIPHCNFYINKKWPVAAIKYRAAIFSENPGMRFGGANQAAASMPVVFSRQ